MITTLTQTRTASEKAAVQEVTQVTAEGMHEPDEDAVWEAEYQQWLRDMGLTQKAVSRADYVELFNPDGMYQ